MANKPKAVAQAILSPVVKAPFVMPADASPAFVSGTELAVSNKAEREANKARFAALDSPQARADFRKGYVARYMYDEECDKVKADSAFDYQASKYAPPESSRKAKANAKKSKRGRKAKEKAEVTEVSGKDAILRLLAGTAHAAEAQRKFTDPAFVAWLGEHVAILNGESPKQ